MTNWRNWLKGALSAAISGGSSALIAINIDPDHFGASNLKHVALVAGIGAVIGAANYFQKSPLAPAAVSQEQHV